MLVCQASACYTVQMTEKPFLSNQRISNCLDTYYGIKVSLLTLLTQGADLHSSVYKVEALEGQAYFVKLKRGHLAISLAIMELLHTAGIRQIIFPVQTKQGEFSQAIEEFTLIVSPFIAGQDGFSQELTDEQWMTLGSVMRQVHDCHVPASLQKQLRRETFSPQWRAAVRALYTQIAAGISGDEIASQLISFMKKNSETILHLVSTAEQLSQQVQQNLPAFVLCHSDIHGGNVLLETAGALYVVDWDDPIMAPKERDLMFIGGGVANVWNQEYEEKLFYKGYGACDVNLPLLAYYRHERIVEDIALIGQQLLLATTGGENRAVVYQHFVAQFESNGVVDIAFATAKKC
jgi:spectinomycin phosphotransferase